MPTNKNALTEILERDKHTSLLFRKPVLYHRQLHVSSLALDIVPTDGPNLQLNESCSAAR
jgi:hypothetical protein